MHSFLTFRGGTGGGTQSFVHASLSPPQISDCSVLWTSEVPL